MSAGPHPSPDPLKHPLATPPGTYAATTLAVKIVKSLDLNSKIDWFKIISIRGFQVIATFLGV